MPFAEDTKQAIHVAQSLAKEYQHAHFGPPHLLAAVLHNETPLASWLVAQQKDLHFMRDWAEIRMEEYPRGSRASENPSADAKTTAVLDLADMVALQLNRDEVDGVSVLAALLKPGVGFTPDQLKSFPATQKEIMDAAVSEVQMQQAVGASAGAAASNGAAAQSGATAPTGASNALYRFCTDKTALAAEGKLDPIVGRDKELRMVMEVLGRRTKPNVIIVGEPGVGKTALVDGFAQAIVAGSVPQGWQGAHLLELDTGALVAGAAYKGELEDRMKGIIGEVKRLGKSILFIDEVHLLLDPKSALGGGLVNLLKPELARGELTVIGATTRDEYRKYVESDEAFNRRFEIIQVEEPDVDTAVEMLKRVAPLYETHHGLTIEPAALKEAVVMAKRYAKDRYLPDSAVDLVDRTMAALRIMNDTSVRELRELRERLETMDPDDIQWAERTLKDKISPILSAQLEPEVEADLDVPGGRKQRLEQKITQLEALAENIRDTVTKADIAAVVSYKTGIPLGKIQSSEREKLLGVEDVLKRRVIGQDHAIKAVAEAILESRSGLIKAGQPIASFFLLGPTGTGKTELAKTLSDFLFNDESFLIRFDMSEFKEEHSAALLYGAPPGYVGYEEGGMLVNKIREKPYSVVLFDEIEKAHPSVFDTFLQVLDEGKLHDRLGKEGDFSNAIILFTSNIASDFIVESFGGGKIPAGTELMDIMSRHFRPEFLGRLTEIVPFAPIAEENALRIFDVHLRSLTDPLTRQGISLEITPEAKKHLTLTGFTPKYGARQIKGLIRNELRRPIARQIVAGKLKKGDTVCVGYAGGLTWEIKHPSLIEI
ncbi:ATP-dependent Clp protease ATP-binding subunit [Dinghuibacter silviterrae]|uniref:ATP-dependent Clp protease ATP-binding subunit ClpA n=1 Tax=Dinghuibacter silviterrae TaxID=1539049 RepID=A0A4R8DUD8_9BACT|nr:ATP-dependent Clp protease ATP-binding subunit [Dinghuibacter silviterrae]TDX01984.1 ATP-dependent Clp protease ATP-binding subunit ClpA [Dinghuibacter silviterrae]